MFSYLPSIDADEVLKLLDSYWFHHEIFTGKSPLSSHPTDPVHQIQDEFLKPEDSSLPTLLVPTRSDQLSCKTTFNSGSLSPNSVLSPKLQTILSGKEVEDDTNTIIKQEEMERPFKKVKGRRTKKKGGNNSLSDLELEELKGFMDLGFVFSEEDKDSNLVSILPGLRRLDKKDGEEDTIDESAISRPYLSEAWAVLDRRMEENALINWKFPAIGNDLDMKYHLKRWAHAVASTVR